MRLTEVKTEGNAGAQWTRIRNPSRVFFNSLVITVLKYLPPFELKNSIYRTMLGIKIGKDVAISPDVIFDPFNPELIEIGDGTLIGWGAHIWTHEFWVDRIRTGPVKIGKKVLLGGFSVVRPGTTIGNKAVIASNSFVNKSVPAGAFVGGIPIRPLKRGA